MRKLLLFSVMCTGLAVPMTGHAKGAETQRTVYFSAFDAKGTAVTDLTAADLAVKENGKDRAIASVVAATEPILVSILVDDGGSGGFQAPVAQFLDAMAGHAQFAIRAFNPQPTRVADFTADTGALQKALTAIGQRGLVNTAGDQMQDAINEAATELQKRKAPRAAIVVLTAGGEKALSTQAESTLTALKNSGASLHVVHLAGIELGQVLGDGPKRSGGTVQQITGGVVPGPVLAKIADALLKQYVLTYTLPDGVKPNDRLSLTTSRKGITLLAPSRIPDSK